MSSPWKVFDVTQYGAVPNNTSMGVTNVNAFNGAIIAAQLTTNNPAFGTVYIPPGNYTLEGTVSIPSTPNNIGISLVGDGPGAAILTQSTPTGSGAPAMIKTIEVLANGCTLRDFGIACEAGTVPAAGIFINQASHTEMVRLNFSGGAYGVYCLGVNAAFMRALSVDLAEVAGIALDGYYNSSGSVEVHITDCTVTGGPAAGIWLGYCAAVYITACSVTGAETQIAFQPGDGKLYYNNGGADQYPSDGLCQNIQVIASSFDGAGVLGTNKFGACFQAALSGDGTAVFPYDYHRIYHVSMCGCTFTSNQENGIAFPATSTFSGVPVGPNEKTSNGRPGIRGVIIADCQVIGNYLDGILINNPSASLIRVQGGVAAANGLVPSADHPGPYANIAVRAPADQIQIDGVSCDVQDPFVSVGVGMSYTSFGIMVNQATRLHASNCNCELVAISGVTYGGISIGNGIDQPGCQCSVQNCMGYNDQALKWTPPQLSTPYNAAQTGQYYGPYLYCGNAGSGGSVTIGAPTGLTSGAFYLQPTNNISVTGSSTTGSAYGM